MRCDDPYTIIDGRCCLDENRNGVCDESDAAPETGDAAADGAVPETAGTDGQEEARTDADGLPTGTDEEPTATASGATAGGKSLTEAYKETFLSKATFYSYVMEDETLGEIWVWETEGLTKVTAEEYFFEATADNTVRRSRYEITKDEDSFLEELKEEEIRIFDYLWHEDGLWHGCYVWGGDHYYLKKNCIFNNRSQYAEDSHQIIYTGIRFSSEPKYPLEWYDELAGRSPSRVLEDYQYVDQKTDRAYRVDQLFFDNADGTVTKLYVNRQSKFPMKVEILRENKPIRSFEYGRLSVNDQGISSWHKVFMEA